MSKSIIIILIFSFILSGISIFIGFLRPPKSHSWLPKGAFIFSTFILIPFLAVVLYFQGTAEGRLSKTGIAPYPNITETVGIAFGTGENPLWVFRTDGPNNIQNFYNYESSRQGWELINSSENSLLLEKGGNEMKISFYEQENGGSIIYKMENK